MDDDSQSSSVFPLALVVLDLAPKVQQETVDWLMGRIEAARSSDGAELKVKVVERSEAKGTVLLVGATLERLLRGAEEAALVKVYQDGNFRPFSFADRASFRETETELLTTAEMLYIIKFQLDNLKAKDEEHIPGEPTSKLQPGKPIFEVLWKSKLLTKLYPMHNREELEKLKALWRNRSYLIDQPVQALRSYFGESVALYFNFLGYFTWGLAFRTLLELFFYVTKLKDRGGCIVCALYNMLWSTVFLEGWKRRSSELAFKWGTLRQMESFDKVRAGYMDKLGADLIPETAMLDRQRSIKMAFRSVPFLVGSLVISVGLIVMFIKADKMAREMDTKEESVRSLLMTYMPILVYSVTVEVLNRVYLAMAKVVTEMENHRLVSTHENHLIAKVLIFYLINNFGMHYYVAFYLKDLKLLADILSAQLLVHQVVGQFFDTVLPYSMTSIRLRRLNKAQPDANAGLHLIEAEGNLRDNKGSLLEDYLELFIKFGFVSLFSSVYPLAGSFSFLNNLLGIKLESMKFSQVLQRQFPVPSSNISAWRLAFEYLTTLAIITNCGLISMSPEFRNLFSELPDLHYFLLAVALEHGFFGMQRVLRLAVPEIPADMEVKLNKIELECRRAMFYNESCR